MDQDLDHFAVLIAAEAGAAGERRARALAAAFEAQRMHALVVPAPEKAEDSDRAARARLDEARAQLARAGRGAVCVCGLGAGAAHAFLYACASTRLAGLLVLDAELELAELGPRHPIQPLELALNLDCPLLALDGPAASAARRAERARLSALLSQAARAFDIVAGARDWAAALDAGRSAELAPQLALALDFARACASEATP
jgi:hypothetical protein